MVKEKIKKPGITQRIHFTSTMSMSLVLFLIGLVSLLLFVARDLGNYVRENINLSVILNDHIQQPYVQRIENYLNSAPFVKSVKYISKDEALKEHIKSLGENPEDFLGYNPLKASLEVKLKYQYANQDSVSIIESKLKAFSNIDEIAYEKDVVNLVNNNINKVSFVLIGIALILLIVSIALINNTVRLGVYSNRFLINTMRLVGATGWFIRKPYVKRGMLTGFIASLVALILLSAMVYYVKYKFGLSGFIINPMSIVYICAIVIASGIIFTSVSSYFAVGRFLRMKTNDLYYI